MADFVFNIAKGRVAEYYNRVQSNDPAASVLRVIAVNSTETDATMTDVDSVSALLALTNCAEVTNTGYTAGGKSLADTDLTALAADDTLDRMDCDVADQTWTSVAAGTAWTDLVFVYDPDGTYTTANCIPLTCHDFAVTPDGTDITATIADFYRAS